MANQIHQRNFSDNRSFFERIVSVAKRPSSWIWHSLNSGSSDTLERISGIADSELAKAKLKAPVPPITSDIHGRIDHALSNNGMRTPNASTSLKVGEIVDPEHPEITRAPRLRHQFEATDWNQKIKDHQKALVQKLSVFTALLQMREICGIQETNNLSLIELVKKATEGSSPISLWSLFTNQYELSIFQTIKAAWVYFLYFQTSLITNTIEAYLYPFINNIRGNLAEENSPVRTKIFQTLIREVHDFLHKDYQASKRFANTDQPLLLHEVKDQEIERHYNGSLPELCQAFAEYRVDTDSPKVLIFKELQDIPVIGWIFVGFAFLINYLIKRAMKNSLLPKALEDAVTKGLEATKPDKLPFAISLTQFFNSQLEKFHVKIQDDENDDSLVIESPGTEELPDTIRMLLRVLEIEGIGGAPELRQKLSEVEKGKWMHRQAVHENIEESVIKGCYLLFDYLHKASESGELFANFLELSLKPFSGEGKSEAILKAEFNDEVARFERVSEKILKKIVKKSISQKFGSSEEMNYVSEASKAFKSQKVVVNEIFDGLSSVIDRIAKKIEAADDNPTPENNIANELAELFQHMQVLSIRKELQDNQVQLDDTNRKEIQAMMNPLFDLAENIQTRAKRLHELQHSYPIHFKVVHHLDEIKDELLNKIQQDPISLRALKHHLRNFVIKITALLGTEAPLKNSLENWIQQIDENLQRVHEKNQTIKALHALYPPRDDNNENRNGLIDQLLQYDRNQHQRGFSLRHCIAEIKSQLIHLPQEEREVLETIIRDGRNIQTRWAALSLNLHQIYSRHQETLQSHRNDLNTQINRFNESLDQIKQEYIRIKNSDYDDMSAEIEEIQESMEQLEDMAQSMRLNPSTPLTRKVWQGISLVAPAFASHFLGPVAGGITGLLGAVGFKKLSKQPHSSHINGASTSISRFVATAGASIASYLHTPARWASVAYPAIGSVIGWQGHKIFQDTSESIAYKEVLAVFKKAYKFSLNPRIYKAATTRAMKALVNA